MRDGPFLRGLRETLDPAKPNVDVLLLNRHMNEPEFADAMAELLEEMLAGTWHKGSHQGSPEAVTYPS